MPFEITTIVAQGVVKTMIDAVNKFVVARFFGSTDDQVIDQDAIGTMVARHLVEAANWSSTLPVFGMSRATDTDTVSVPLTFDEPRRFKHEGKGSQELAEAELLMAERHCVLLGEPGAGKTTTLKRLTRMLLLEDSTGEGDRYQVPIVLRLHTVNREQPLLTIIADTLGLPWRRLTEHPSTGAPLSPPEDWIAGRPLHHILPLLLDEADALLILDGLDEVPGDIRSVRQGEIIALGLKLGKARIITSCRTGDYSSVFDGFDVLEVCPLTPAQVSAIAGRWLSNSGEFIACVEKLPYRDVVNRPLLLTQLIVLFKRDGYLPNQPAHVCRRLVELLLEKWDIERRIERPSHYAGFDATRKAEFLATVAYHLTYVTQSQVFTVDELTKTYLAICDRFDLPSREAALVAAELQTHNGLIAQIGDDAYEFSHLSLQEYLCATYIVRDPIGEKIRHYLAEYPGPVAVAVALAPDSSRWFASIVFRWNPYMTANSTRSFVARLVTERAVFSRSWYLGAAVMRLYLQFNHRSDVTSVLDRFVAEKNVLESVASALRIYDEEFQGEWGTAFVLRRPVTDDVGYAVPKQVGLTRGVLELVRRHAFEHP